MALPETIKKPLDVVSNAIVERFRNPFAASFIISWVLFNWKAITFLILSAHPVEWSIAYISKYFTDNDHYLWFPLWSAIFYSVVLPYIGVGINWLLKYSILFRNNSLKRRRLQAITDEEEIALAQIGLEDKKRERREGKAHNKLVDNLQARIKDLEQQLAKQTNEFQESYNALRDRSNESVRLHTKEREDLVNDITRLQNEKNIFLQREIESQKSIKELSDRMPSGGPRVRESVLKFENGDELIEQRVGDKILYLDIDRERVLSLEEFQKLKDRFGFKRTQLPI